MDVYVAIDEKGEGLLLPKISVDAFEQLSHRHC